MGVNTRIMQVTDQAQADTASRPLHTPGVCLAVGRSRRQRDGKQAGQQHRKRTDLGGYPLGAPGDSRRASHLAPR